MAKTINQLPDATTVNGSDELIIQQSGVTKRATKTEVLSGIVNANIDATAAIAGTKVSPAFGAQNITLEGNVTATKTSGVVAITANMVTDSFVNAPIIGMDRQGTAGAATPSNTRLGEIRFSCRESGGTYQVPVVVSADIGTNAATGAPGALIVGTSPSGTAAASERVRITSTGDVGVGTASPSSRLHVVGDVTLGSATTSTTASTTAGGATLPALAAGYLVVSINGTSRKIPYYAT